MLLSILILAVQAMSFVWLIYCIMTFVSPDSNFVATMRPIAEPLLMPCRRWIYRVFPKAEMLAIDFSPIVVWLLFDVVLFVLGLF